VYISIELVSVFTNGELLVIIYRNIDFLSTYWFIFGVVELGNVWVAKSLLGS